MLSITISRHRLRRLGVILSVINTCFLGVFAMIQIWHWTPSNAPLGLLGPMSTQLNFVSEGVLAVWYSSSLYLLVAVAALLNYWVDSSNRVRERMWYFRYGWLFLAAGAVYLSVDESIAIHENISGWITGNLGINMEAMAGLGTGYAWAAILGPLFLVAALFLLGFFAVWLARVPRARNMAVAGLGCWLVVPVLEFVEYRLLTTFGSRVVDIEQFAEESLEVIGATLLLVAAIEYVIACTAPAPVTAQGQPVPTGRRALWAVSTAPLALALLFGVGLLANCELRGGAASSYQLGADRITSVMHTTTHQGHYLVLSDDGDLASLRAAFPYELDSIGPLVAFPSAAESGSAPKDFVLSVLQLGHDDGQSPAATEAALARTSMMSRELWHLFPSSPSESDLVVEDWLARHFDKRETIWLPGLPAVQLTHVTPSLPLAPAEPEHRLDPAAVFGSDEVRLVGYEWRADQSGDSTTLHVSLFWQVSHPLTTDYHVFVHLIDREGKLVAQSDGQPVYGRYPFSQWKPGEIVWDSYDVPLPSSLALADTELHVGIYDLARGYRLPVGTTDFIQVKRLGEMSPR